MPRLRTEKESRPLFPVVATISKRNDIASMNSFRIRAARAADRADAYYVCLKTGDHGKDGEPFYRDDPDALGRIFVGTVSGV